MIASTWPINDLVSIPQSHKRKKYTYYKSLKLKYKKLVFCHCDALRSNNSLHGNEVATAFGITP